MASLRQVSDTLGALIGAALYPDGATGEAASPVAGVPVRVEVGWPSPQSLDAAMSAHKAHVSIYPVATDRNTNRFLNRDQWDELSRNAATYSLTVTGQSITVGGAAPNPYRAQNLALVLDGDTYAVQATTGQTAAQVATALLAAIATAYPAASRTGAVLSLPDETVIGSPIVGATGTIAREIGRQERRFQIITWAHDPDVRDSVSEAVDIALRVLPRIALPDGYAARLTFAGSMLNDFQQKAGIFRHDLFYTVDYPTTQADVATEIVHFIPDYEATP